MEPDEDTQRFLDEHRGIQKKMTMELAELEQHFLMDKENNVRHVIRQAEYFAREHLMKVVEISLTRHSSIPRFAGASLPDSLSRSKGERKETSSFSSARTAPMRVNGATAMATSVPLSDRSIEENGESASIPSGPSSRFLEVWKTPRSRSPSPKQTPQEGKEDFPPPISTLISLSNTEHSEVPSSSVSTAKGWRGNEGFRSSLHLALHTNGEQSFCSSLLSGLRNFQGKNESFAQVKGSTKEILYNEEDVKQEKEREGLSIHCGGASHLPCPLFSNLLSSDFFSSSFSREAHHGVPEPGNSPFACSSNHGGSKPIAAESTYIGPHSSPISPSSSSSSLVEKNLLSALSHEMSLLENLGISNPIAAAASLAMPPTSSEGYRPNLEEGIEGSIPLPLSVDAATASGLSARCCVAGKEVAKRQTTVEPDDSSPVRGSSVTHNADPKAGILPMRSGYSNVDTDRRKKKKKRDEAQTKTADAEHNRMSTGSWSVSFERVGEVESGVDDEEQNTNNNYPMEHCSRWGISSVLHLSLLVILSSWLWIVLMLPDALEVSSGVAPPPLRVTSHLTSIAAHLEGLLWESTAIFCILLVLFIAEMMDGRGFRWLFQHPWAIRFVFHAGGMLFAFGLLLIGMSIPDSFLMSRDIPPQAGAAQHSAESSPISSSTLADQRGATARQAWLWALFRGGKTLEGVGAVLLFLGWLGVTATEVGFTAGLILHLQLVLLLWPATLLGTFTIAPFLTSYFMSEVDLFRDVVVVGMVGVLLLPLLLCVLIPPAALSLAPSRHLHQYYHGASRWMENAKAKEEQKGRGFNRKTGVHPTMIHKDSPREESFLSKGPCTVVSSLSCEESSTSHRSAPHRCHTFQVLRLISPRFFIRVFVLSTLLTALLLVVYTAPATLSSPSALPSHNAKDGMYETLPGSSSSWRRPFYELGSIPEMYTYFLMMHDSPEAVMRAMAFAAVVMWPFCFIPSFALRIRYYVPTSLLVIVVLLTWGLSVAAVKVLPMLVTAVCTGISLQLFASSVVRSLGNAVCCWKVENEDTQGSLSGPHSTLVACEQLLIDEIDKKEKSEACLVVLPQEKGEDEKYQQKVKKVSESTSLLTFSHGNTGLLDKKVYGSEDAREDDFHIGIASHEPTIEEEEEERASRSGRGRERAQHSVDMELGKATMERPTSINVAAGSFAREQSKRKDVEDVFLFSFITTTRGSKKRSIRSKGIPFRPEGPWESLLATGMAIAWLLLVLVLSTAVAWASLLDAELSSGDHSPTFAGGVTEDAHHALVNVLLGLGTLAFLGQILEVVAERNQWDHLFPPSS